jgi:hypothetical protein
MKVADIIVCTVYLWFLTVLLLFPSTTDHLRTVLDARRNHEHASDNPEYVIIKGRLALSVTLLGVYTCWLCLTCVRVMWPTVLTKGERHNAISRIVANEWRMLVGTMRHAPLLIINSLICLAYDLCVVRITVWLRVLLVVTHTVTGTENILVWKRLFAIHRHDRRV